MENILKTVLTLSTITGLLSLLLSIANKTIANYGTKKLIINQSKEYLVEGGDSLLSTLNEQNIFIPSACGGKGSCGYCKVKVISGGGPFLSTEKGYVTEKERVDGIRLSCQLKVKQDIEIEIPEELFNVKQLTYLVTGIEDLTSKIKKINFKLPENESLDYKPGQYVQILTPPYEGNEEVYRAYSIATPPSSKHAIELFIGYVPDGICTTYIHKYLKVGDKLSIVGPFGDFYYREGDKDMLMFAIGTGIAPIMSILRYMNENNIERKVTFFFGARTRKDLFLIDELHSLEKTMYEFKLVLVLSRPTPECNWNGEIGRVTDLVSKYILDANNKEAYLCGNPPMIDDLIPLLKDKGFIDENILYDKFE
ncbi:MAG: 2Fe-2S iron-sulfur cluster binding domain-containing protein [Tissierellales bacterium]|nr:2Fe-2S iron-sulfur cluster binding domain-containing protein [Tissierellales bacterium]MBN2827233.1 2Fe-2S iron-sulfur cluster binding domain-containing protein [Tissierellales bacterium]